MVKCKLVIIVVSLFTALLLPSCSDSTPIEAPTIKVIITDVVDKATGVHLDDFTLTFRKETPDGVLISSEEYSDTIDVSTAIPADASVRLFVDVKAPGYVPYITAIRGKYYSDKVVEILVEMEKFKTIDS
jgi:hypothetical protein